MENLGAQEVEFSSAQPAATFVSGELGWERNMFQYQLHILVIFTQLAPHDFTHKSVNYRGLTMVGLALLTLTIH